MKTHLSKAMAITVLLSGFASQAYAEHPTSTQGKRIEANEAYWKANPQSGGMHTADSTYDFNNKPEQRMAERNAEYFSGKGTTASMIAKNPDYEFASKPEQRTAKRNYDYFRK